MLTSLASVFLMSLWIGAGLVAAPLPETVSAVVPNSPPTLIEHLRNELQSKDAMRREYALIDVINLANCPGSCTVSLRSIEEQQVTIENETGMGSVVDLTALVPDLVETYRSGPADGHRLLALSALLHVGNEKAIDRLIDESASQSEAVNRATHQRLAAFYLEHYPELTKRTMRTKEVSLEDVLRARALRVKNAKKAEKNGN